MGFFDIVFPKRCVGCGRIGKYFCLSCRRTIRYIDVPKYPAGLNGLTSFFRYNGIIKNAIKAIKYRYISDLATELISLLPSIYIPNVQILIPIPLHVSRYKERGFNQAEVLGRRVAEKLHIPVHTDILRRTKITVPQAELKRKERLENMKQVFTSYPETRNIALFDDVFTTGATMRSAAHELKKAGSRFVWGITIAR